MFFATSNAFAKAPVAPADAKGSEGVFYRVGIDVITPVVAIANQPVPVVVQVRECLARIAAGQYVFALRIDPLAQLVQYRDGVLLALAVAFIRRLVFDASLDEVKRLDKANGFEGLAYFRWWFCRDFVGVDARRRCAVPTSTISMMRLYPLHQVPARWSRPSSHRTAPTWSRAVG